jgi:hypothetical protein
MKRIISTDHNEIIMDREYPERQFDHTFKPLGLWYSIGMAWLNWCDGNMEEWIHKNIIEIDIDESNLLVIATLGQLKDFIHKYKEPLYPGSNMCGIKWVMVKKDYTGIEIRNYPTLKWADDYFFLNNNTWFYGWDVSSGCIWDLSIITNQKCYGFDRRYLASSLSETENNQT